MHPIFVRTQKREKKSYHGVQVSTKDLGSRAEIRIQHADSGAMQWDLIWRANAGTM